MRSLPGPLCPSVGQGRDSVASPPCPASDPPPRTQVSPGSLGEHRQVREVPSPRGCWPPAGFPGKCGQHWVTDYRHSPTPSTQAGLLGTPGRNRLRARGRSLRAPPEGVSRLLEGQPVSQFQSSESRGTERRGEMTAACAGAQGLMSGAQHPGARGPGPSAGRSGSWLEKGGGSKTGGQRLAWPFPCAGVPLKAPVEPAGTCSPRRATVESPEAPGGGGGTHSPTRPGAALLPSSGEPGSAYCSHRASQGAQAEQGAAPTAARRLTVPVSTRGLGLGQELTPHKRRRHRGGDRECGHPGPPYVSGSSKL